MWQSQVETNIIPLLISLIQLALLKVYIDCIDQKLVYL